MKDLNKGMLSREGQLSNPVAQQDKAMIVTINLDNMMIAIEAIITAEIRMTIQIAITTIEVVVFRAKKVAVTQVTGIQINATMKEVIDVEY